MAELLADGADWKNLTPAVAVNQDKSTVVAFAGAPSGKHPELRLSSSESAALATDLVKPPVAPPAPTPSAPVLKVNGQRIEWVALPGVTSYKGAIITASGTSYVTGLTSPWSPPKATGTVKYGLSAEKPKAGPWATEVPIDWGEVPAPPPPPPPPPPPVSTGFTPGGVTRSDDYVPSVLAPPIVRMEFGLGESIAAQAEALAKRGMLLQPLLSVPNSLLMGNLQQIVAWCVAGVKLVEVGNELGYSYKIGANKGAGEQYAKNIVKPLAEILAPHGVGVLAECEDGNTGSPNWAAGQFAAVPGYDKLVAGYTIHPYYSGDTWKADGDPGGVPKLARCTKVLVGLGATKAWHATEWGVESTAAGTKMVQGEHFNFEEAAAMVEGHPGELKKAAEPLGLASLLWYQLLDQHEAGGTEREWYYGALLASGARKDPLTSALEAFWKS